MAERILGYARCQLIESLTGKVVQTAPRSGIAKVNVYEVALGGSYPPPQPAQGPTALYANRKWRKVERDEEIRNKHRSGVGRDALCQQYGLGETRISQILRQATIATT
jgi:hypothetical protein